MLLLGCAIPAAAMPSPVNPQALAPSDNSGTTLTIIGHGMVRRDPDTATLRIGVVTNDDDATTSSARNSGIATAITGRLTALGIPQSSIRTASYNVTFVPHPSSPPPPGSRQPRYGYVVERQIAATTVTLAGLGRAIDAALDAGATGIFVSDYDVSDRVATESEAVEQAISDAKRQATQIANASGQRIAAVKEIVVDGRPPFTTIGRVATSNGLETIQRPATEITPQPIEIYEAATVTFVLR
jgi:hypothetical protein